MEFLFYLLFLLLFFKKIQYQSIYLIPGREELRDGVLRFESERSRRSGDADASRAPTSLERNDDGGVKCRGDVSDVLLVLSCQ